MNVCAPSDNAVCLLNVWNNFMYVLLLVSPVVEWDRVIPGVTNTTVSWIVQGNLTQLNLLCQVTTDPGTTTEVT